MSRLDVGSVVSGLLKRFPASWAEPWDRIGLVAGDAAWPASRVLCALDADQATVDRAVEGGFGLLVTHHPPFLEDVGDLTPGSGGRAAAWRAVTSGVAIASFHTNVDRSPEGASVLASLLGYEGEPLEVGERDAILLTVYVPPADAERVREAMAGAGAGRIGTYEACSFTAEGVGSFIPGPGSTPAVGTEGEPGRADELCVEMVSDPSIGGRVLAAAREAHPYEEPVMLTNDVRVSRGGARLGRVCDGPERRLDDLAAAVASALDTHPRVWGTADTPVRRVGFANGSATSLLSAAMASGADALVCGEVRYHAAQEAAAAGLGIIEAGHDASEWPLVRILADAVREAAGDAEIDVVEAAFEPRWWTWGGR